MKPLLSLRGERGGPLWLYYSSWSAGARSQLIAATVIGRLPKRLIVGDDKNITFMRPEQMRQPCQQDEVEDSTVCNTTGHGPRL
ncbi:g5654 [Coccomyxa elongata]